MEKESKKNKNQAVAELSQAQVKLEFGWSTYFKKLKKNQVLLSLSLLKMLQFRQCLAACPCSQLRTG